MTNSQSFAVNDDEYLPEPVCKTQEAVAMLAENFIEWMRAVLDAAYALLTKAKDSEPDNAAIRPSSTPSAKTSRIRRFVRLRPDFASWQITMRLQLRRRIHFRGETQGRGGASDRNQVHRRPRHSRRWWPSRQAIADNLRSLTQATV